MIRGGAHDAEKRDSRPVLDLVEHEVRSIRGDKTKVCACTRQHFQAGGKIIGQFVKAPCIEHGNALIDVEAVDDQVRISPAGLPGAIARDDRAIVVDSGLGPKPSDHADGSHVSGKRCATDSVGFDNKLHHAWTGQSPVLTHARIVSVTLGADAS